ncbi:MAG: aminotransferase class V-fold PLP-dependent enzyme [Lachnospiraceae bacterium]|nr:aminotransferase class V-fold PLP-dependent enzyme [Lachnospiraceae bacterium]
MIYFDNAATTLHKPESVAKAVYDGIMTMGNAARGAHEASLLGMRTLYETRTMLQEMYHPGAPEQVAFTANSTDSLNIAISGLFQPGDHVITTCLEHNSVLRPLYRLEETGLSLSIVPADRKGNPDYDKMEEMITPKTKGIIMTHASNLTGNVTDLKRVGQLCKKHGLLFVVDGSQTGGIFPIPMDEYHISVLCLTGHKGLLGPQGTGAILVKEGVHVRPFRVGGSGILSYSKTHPEVMPTALEAGTLNIHGIAGLCAALKYIKETGIDQIRKKEQELMWHFYEGIKEIPGLHFYGDFDTKERAAIVSFNIEDYDSAIVSDELMERFEIATRAGAHCAPLMHESFGTKEQGAVRFSFSHFNTLEEVEKGIEAVRILATEE